MTQIPQNNWKNEKWCPWNRPYVVTSDPVYCKICQDVFPQEEIEQHFKECHDTDTSK
jgi:hypothetical protein